MSPWNNYCLLVLLTLLTSVWSVHWVFYKVLRIAREKRLLDAPDARKLQKEPIPVLGGIAVFFGFIVGTVAGFCYLSLQDSFSVVPMAALLGVLIVLLYTGAMDDIVGLRPSVRMFIEILSVLAIIWTTGGSIDSLHGLWGVESIPSWGAVALTVFAGVGVINAVNMVDGVNGLSSGLCIVCSSIFCYYFCLLGDWANVVLASSLAASLIPFLAHNVFGKRSKMFIGDAGTMVMGMLMVWFSISVLRSDTAIPAEGIGRVAFNLAILSVPVFDTVRVMTMRIFHGRSPFSADKTHLHHAFILAGFSHSMTSVSVILIDLIIVTLWFMSWQMGASVDVQCYVVIGSAVLLIWGTYAFLSYHASHHTRFMHALSHYSIETHFGRKAWWQSIQQWVDRKVELTQEERVEQEYLLRKKQQKFSNLENDELQKMEKEMVREYLRGKAEVHVKDLMKRYDMPASYAHEVITDLVNDGCVRIITYDADGNAEIVGE